MSSGPRIVVALVVVVVAALAVAAPASAANFTCNHTAVAECGGVIGYVAANATTYGAVRSLFQVSTLAALLGANDLPPSTPAAAPVAAGGVVRVPFPCACSNGTGRSNRTPTYTSKNGDTLDAIARNVFGGFVTYEEIADANQIPNPNVISVGDKLWIPLPCSCDPVGGEAVVHLGYSVPHGSTVEGIAEEFGVDNATLMEINGIADPSKLQAEQILDVPLRACSSSIRSNSLDSNLRLANGSYVLTANGCIFCSCSSSSYQLNCSIAQNKSSSECDVPKCPGNLFLGSTSSSGCNVTTCAYNGYTNATGLNISVNPVTNQTKCSSSKY
ncbi:Chitin elicitor-binding protein [Ananas comosus]|uniref:Chitin elicitor-binding protein n=1 Tax=Ananas comosus TaxID=4615 RepID=A0A199V1B8_ANACO|nr:Chitin elicitor-binding protein [Ananas comosus]